MKQREQPLDPPRYYKSLLYGAILNDIVASVECDFSLTIIRIAPVFNWALGKNIHVFQDWIEKKGGVNYFVGGVES